MKPLRAIYSKTPSKTPKFSHLYLRLRSRFTLYFFLLIVIPYVLLSMVIYFHTRSLMEEKAYEAALTGITQEQNSIGKYVSELVLALNTFSDSLQPADQARLANSTSLVRQSAQLEKMAHDTLSTGQLKALSAVYLINSGGVRASFGTDADQAAISSPTSQQWYTDTVNDPGSVQLLGTVQRFYEKGKSKTVICAAKALGGSPGPDDAAVLLFDFDYSLLTDFLSNTWDPSAYIPESRRSERLILDNSGNIIYCSNPGRLTTKADSTLLGAVGSGTSGYKHQNNNDEDQYLTYIKYPKFGWTFIDLKPASGVTGRIWLRSPAVTLCFILFPFIVLVYLGLSLKLLRPINELTSVISDYENQFPEGSDHTPLLSGNHAVPGMNGSTDIDFFINKIYSIKLRQKEAELNSLQNQINPHFLYNTLESIRGAALYHGITEIAAMSKALSLLFRYSISDRVLVTIKEELQHLENYISIQNFRYENKFELQYNIPPELMNYKVLKLTLQPLIENSIKHGLEMKLGKGTISIEVLVLDSNIKIIISDDGLGIPAKKLEELNRSLASEKSQAAMEGDRSSTGIGVVNVNSRIKLYFGEQYGLKFREALVGTTVEITLPAVKEN
ncbi:MAG TPA: sensor histidine kinase [Clostridia bacterium]|nr:sensor histidine kinase [Clostridia bacterium]